MRIRGFLPVLLFLCIHAFATSQDVQLKWKAKRDTANVSEHYEDDEFMTETNDNMATHVCYKVNDANSNGKILISINNSSRNITTEIPSDIDLSMVNPEFPNCTHIAVELECYENLPNGSVYVPLDNKLLNTSDYVINEQNVLFMCPEVPVPEDDGMMPLVTIFCAFISTFCIILHTIMFLVVKNLRNLPGYCLLSLCFALLAAYSCIFAQDADGAYGPLGCTVIGLTLMYFLLASFFWMNVLAYDVWKSIRLATIKLQLTTERSMMAQLARYSVFGWGAPLVIVMASIIVHFVSEEGSKYKLTFNAKGCWFQYKEALTFYFAGPLIVILVVNFFFFVSSFCMITKAAKIQTGSRGFSDLKSRLFLCFRLGSVIGIMWSFGIAASITRIKELWILCSVASGLKGVFIFFSFTLSKSTIKTVRKAMRKGRFSTVSTPSTSEKTTSVATTSQIL